MTNAPYFLGRDFFGLGELDDRCDLKRDSSLLTGFLLNFLFSFYLSTRFWRTFVEYCWGLHRFFRESRLIPVSPSDEILFGPIFKLILFEMVLDTALNEVFTLKFTKLSLATQTFRRAESDGKPKETLSLPRPYPNSFP